MGINSFIALIRIRNEIYTKFFYPMYFEIWTLSYFTITSSITLFYFTFLIYNWNKAPIKLLIYLQRKVCKSTIVDFSIFISQSWLQSTIIFEIIDFVSKCVWTTREHLHFDIFIFRVFHVDKRLIWVAK